MISLTEIHHLPHLQDVFYEFISIKILLNAQWISCLERKHRHNLNYSFWMLKFQAFFSTLIVWSGTDYVSGTMNWLCEICDMELITPGLWNGADYALVVLFISFQNKWALFLLFLFIPFQNKWQTMKSFVLFPILLCVPLTEYLLYICV